MTYSFTIDGMFYNERTLPGLNDFLHQCNKNPKAGNTMKRNYQMIISNFIRKQLRGQRIYKLVHITYKYYEPDRRRDKDNIAGTAHKFIQDALVTCRTLDNDGWANISGFTDLFYVDKNHPRIEVELTEVEE